MKAIIKPVIATLLLPTLSPLQGVAKIDYDYEYVNTVTGKALWTRTAKGMIVVDNDSIWALQPFSASRESMERFAGVVNRYRAELPAEIRIYAMPVPAHAAYYTPDSVGNLSRPHHPAMIQLFETLDKDITPVDIFGALGRHADEPIYLRTDHHWAARGAYYAARELAREAGVPFSPLSEYTPHTIDGFVGTMYRFSGDRRVKNCPEPFVYYVPKRDDYTTYYVDYRLDGSRKNVIGAAPEKTGPLFVKTSLSSSYCTFGGGDAKIIRVETNVRNGRRILLIKDSFGNALTPFLTGSFDEVHVIDCRFFARNIKSYIEEYDITDIVFCNNVTFCSNKKTTDMLLRYLTQPDRFLEENPEPVMQSDEN